MCRGDEAGDLPVYVMAYPMPVKEGGCWWTLLSAGDHEFIRAFVDDLNDTIQEVAAEHGFKFVAAVESSFVDDRLRICDRHTPRGLGMNFIALNPVSGRLIDVINPKNWIHNSFHPNEIGHEAMGETVQAALVDGELGDNEPIEELAAADVATPCPAAVTPDGRTVRRGTTRAMRSGDLRLGLVADAAAGSPRRADDGARVGGGVVAAAPAHPTRRSERAGRCSRSSEASRWYEDGQRLSVRRGCWYPRRTDGSPLAKASPLRSDGDVGAVWCIARSGATRRARAPGLLLAALVGLAGAAVLTASAGARRTASAYERLSESVKPRGPRGHRRG